MWAERWPVLRFKSDTRKQPKALESLELAPEIRCVVPTGGVIIFSAAQLHSTVPNNAGKTRYSIDFRTIHRCDLQDSRGATNVDSACTGTCSETLCVGRTCPGFPMTLSASTTRVRRKRGFSCSLLVEPGLDPPQGLLC